MVYHGLSQYRFHSTQRTAAHSRKKSTGLRQELQHQELTQEVGTPMMDREQRRRQHVEARKSVVLSDSASQWTGLFVVATCRLRYRLRNITWVVLLNSFQVICATCWCNCESMTSTTIDYWGMLAWHWSDHEHGVLCNQTCLIAWVVKLPQFLAIQSNIASEPDLLILLGCGGGNSACRPGLLQQKLYLYIYI